jgi:hypothetical protein
MSFPMVPIRRSAQAEAEVVGGLAELQLDRGGWMDGFGCSQLNATATQCPSPRRGSGKRSYAPMFLPRGKIIIRPHQTSRAGCVRAGRLPPSLASDSLVVMSGSGRKGKGKDATEARAAGAAFWKPGEAHPALAASSKPKQSAGASEGLLGMKFMQRRAKADADAAAILKEKEEEDEEFDCAWAAESLGLKASVASESGVLLQCAPEIARADRVILGRRSFMGFNKGVEHTYEACIVSLRGEGSAKTKVESVDEDVGAKNSQDFMRRSANNTKRQKKRRRKS